VTDGGLPALDAMLAAWPPVERERLGDWTLRFAGGFTGRANSVLPHGDPGLALEQAIERCEAAYGARGLPARFMLRHGSAPAGLDELLARRGYRAENLALVLAGPLPPTLDVPGTTHADAPSEQWIDTWRVIGGRPTPPQEAHARALLSRVSMPRTFALATDEGRPIATALGTISPGWLGLSCLAVRDEVRRAGVATRLLGSLAGWARERGAERLWLEVERENERAIAWYRRLGLVEAGSYAYRMAPSISRTTS
jgi:GNAT superfamily N-acetyltransferase